MHQSLTHQEAIRRNAQRGMVMEAAPVAALEVVEAKLLLQFLIVPLDAPAHLDDLHHCLLYTSDAADERSSVDLGGRRIIKKKQRAKMDACDVELTKTNEQENRQ